MAVRVPIPKAVPKHPADTAVNTAGAVRTAVGATSHAVRTTTPAKPVTITVHTQRHTAIPNSVRRPRGRTHGQCFDAVPNPATARHADTDTKHIINHPGTRTET